MGGGAALSDRGLFIVTLSVREGSGEGHNPRYLASLGLTGNVSLATLNRPCLLGLGSKEAGRSMGKAGRGSVSLETGRQTPC